VYKGTKIWGIICVVSVLIILAPLWATLFAIWLGTSAPWLIEFITHADKFVSVFGVLLFVISIHRFSHLLAQRQEQKHQDSIFNQLNH
jgi:membrane protein implicated in regulation of membrane protease activity